MPGAVYLEQPGATNSGKPMHLSRTGDYNDFAFSIDGKGPDGCSSNKGTFRAIHIRDDIYVLQILCEADEPVYDLQFYSISNGRYHKVVPFEKKDGDGDARLARFNVKYKDGDLSGAPSDINAYLRSFKDADFQASDD